MFYSCYYMNRLTRVTTSRAASWWTISPPAHSTSLLLIRHNLISCTRQSTLINFHFLIRSLLDKCFYYYNKKCAGTTTIQVLWSLQISNWWLQWKSIPQTHGMKALENNGGSVGNNSYNHLNLHHLNISIILSVPFTTGFIAIQLNSERCGFIL